MRFLCHTAHTPYLAIVTDFLSLQAHYSHPEILFSHLIEKKFSPHENTVPFMPFSLFSVRYAAQLRQLRFRTPLPTGIQGTKTRRQDPKKGPQPACAKKRMRNGKRKIDRMAPCERRKKKPEKCCGGRTTEASAHPPVFPAKQERGTSASMWDNTPPLRACKSLVVEKSIPTVAVDFGRKRLATV